MPVHRGFLGRICNSVFDSDSESITPICLNERCGKLPVHEQKTLAETIRSFSVSRDGKAVVSAHVCNWNITFVRVGVWGGVVFSGCRVVVFFRHLVPQSRWGLQKRGPEAKVSLECLGIFGPRFFIAAEYIRIDF